MSERPPTVGVVVALAVVLGASGGLAVSDGGAAGIENVILVLGTALAWWLWRAAGARTTFVVDADVLSVRFADGRSTDVRMDDIVGVDVVESREDRGARAPGVPQRTHHVDVRTYRARIVLRDGSAITLDGPRSDRAAHYRANTERLRRFLARSGWRPAQPTSA